MKSPLPSLTLLATAAVGVLAKISYDGAKAIRIPVGEDVTSVLEIIQTLELETWKGVAEGIPVANGHVDLVVPANKVEEFEKLSEGFATQVMHEDLGASIADESKIVPYVAGRAVDSTDLSWFNAYHAYNDHIAFITDLAASYPENSEIVTAGKSVEGRDIVGIHIWGREGKGKKKSVVLHGTVHAREWISAKTTQYLAHYLLTNLATDNEIRKFVNRYDFHIFPVVNPDGFVYTQTTNRLWRKNRQAVATSTCRGRDINRNWAFNWQLLGGASTNPCSDTYKGLAPKDTPENQGLSAYIDELSASNGIQLYLDVHSYGQYILSPYGYNCTAYPPNNDALIKTARRAAEAIQAVSGTVYTYGPSCATLYATTGSSVDYIHAVGKSKYTYTIELRDKGLYGFVLPASQILPTVVETWAGFRHLLKDI